MSAGPRHRCSKSARPGSGGPAGLRRLGVARSSPRTSTVWRGSTSFSITARRILTSYVALESWDHLERFGFSYRAPHDVTDADQKVDCSCSNEVLEHIPPDQRVRCWQDCGGDHRITTHSIDYSDHYAR